MVDSDPIELPSPEQNGWDGKLEMVDVVIPNADQDALLDSAGPGDRVTIQGFINRIEVEPIDVPCDTGRQVIRGNKTITLLLVRVDKVGVQ